MKGRGLISTAGMDAHVELLALVKEQAPIMEEGEVGNEMLHFCRIKNL